MNKLNSFKILGALLLLIVGCAASYYFFNEKDEVSKISLGYNKKLLQIGNKNITVQYFVIDTKDNEVGIVTPEIIEKTDKNSLNGGYTLKEYQEKGGFKIVQSGGFLSSWAPPTPLGYVKSRDIEFNKVHNTWITAGVFCTNGSDFEIIKFKGDKEIFKNWKSCLQAGPILAIDGRDVLARDKKNYYVTEVAQRQSFLCKTRKGHLVMGIAENPKLIDLVSFLIKENGDFDCLNATLLNSKGVSGIFSNQKKSPSEIGEVNTILPNAIIVK